MLLKKGSLTKEQSWAAAKDNGKAKWVQLSSQNKGQVTMASKHEWSKNLNAFSKADNAYPYWVGTV